MIPSCPVILMSQETKYSLTSEYLGCNINTSGSGGDGGDQLQNPFHQTQLYHEEQQQMHPSVPNPSQVNLNIFDIQSLYSQTSSNEQQLQIQVSNSLLTPYQDQQQQQSIASIINEFSLMHDQQVDLLNQRRIRDRLGRRSNSSRETFSHRSNSGNLNENSGIKSSPSSSPSSSSTTCFVTGNQGVLGLNSSTTSPSIAVSLATGHQSPLSSSSHHTPPDSPITDLCHSLTAASNSITMTLGNNNNNNNNNHPGCNNTMSPETRHSSYVTSSNGSDDRRTRTFSIPGQVTSSVASSRGGQLTVSSVSPLATSSSHIQEASSTGPFLRIIEQPTNRIRYRYKSEKGSHGGLTGEHNSQSKKTYPTVKLENYKFNPNVNIMIKASLVTNEEHPKPHVHKLMGRHCTLDGTCLLPLSENYTASFQNLGILFIGKKEVPDILYQRKLKESRFFINEEESTAASEDQLAEMEKQRMREEAEREAKDMNLNCVKLSFQAFDCTLDPNNSSSSSSSGNQFSLQGITQPQIAQINFPITTPVFSRPIANQKSPDSGELKIIRMDRNSGCVSGDEEVFLLCEKVNKKEIKVRFFEPDGDGNLIWEEFGNFSESDVHHQVAIVFRTPAYRQVDANTLAHVYLQLYRPKDGEYSEPRQFTYYPRSSYPPHPQEFVRSTVESNKRRKLMSYHSAPTLGQHQIQSNNQRCPNVNISTLAQSQYHPHQHQESMNGQQMQQQSTGLISTSSATAVSHHSPTSTSSPGMQAVNPMSGFYPHHN